MVLQYNDDQRCKKCGKQYTNRTYKWCKQCQKNYLKADFIKWTSGNEKIDDFIQEMQLKFEYNSFCLNGYHTISLMILKKWIKVVLLQYIQQYGRMVHYIIMKSKKD